MARSKRKKTGPASVARWEKDEEIPLDAQEQFHAQRDRILLEGDDAADDDFEDDDEVFALRGVGDDDSDDDEDDEDEPEPVKASSSSKSKSKSKAKDKKKTKTAQQSDGSEGDSESDEGWGRKKSAYYADDAVDSDDEEANELQEAEVRRAQAKARAALTDDDFGLADLRISDDPLPSGSEDPDAVAPAAPPPPDLARQSPETLALAAEWADVAHALQRAERALERTHAADPSALSLGLLHVHHQTLLTYATTLAFYFRLRTAERYRARPALLREHPVLKRLLVLKQALSTLEDLDFAGDSDDDEEDESESDELSTDADLDEDDEDEELDADGDDDGWKKLELAELLADSEKYGDVDADDDTTKRKKRRVKPAAPPPLELPKTKSKSKSKKADAKQVFDLVEPAFVSSKAPRLPTVAEADEFGDPLALQAADAADKKARRHTLRFHAAKIESASARRKGKRAELGGDEDVPYPERRKDRERRQAEELERRRAKLGQGGDDLDGEEPELEKETRKKRRRDEEEEEMDVDQDGDEDGYYQLVAGARKAAKKMKKEQYDAERAAERVVEDDEGADGPRALTRAILKNKGLTPKRAKSVRNPRVKKRLRYEKAQKRVASQRAVFKGGLAGSKGVYEGEHSGINPRVVKSTRLG